METEVTHHTGFTRRLDFLTIRGHSGPVLPLPVVFFVRSVSPATPEHQRILKNIEPSAVACVGSQSLEEQKHQLVDGSVNVLDAAGN
jgi:hypothetical protein